MTCATYSDFCLNISRTFFGTASNFSMSAVCMTSILTDLSVVSKSFVNSNNSLCEGGMYHMKNPVWVS